MKQKYKKVAFTLIELMVAIALIGILAVGATRVNFNTMSKKQELEIFTNKIVGTYETARNNSLLGKGIGTNLQVPLSWKIDFNNSGNGSISTSYLSGSTWNIYESLDFGTPNIYNIASLGFSDITGAPVTSIPASSTGTFIFTGSNITLTGAVYADSKNLIINIENLQKQSRTLKINSLNGIIESN